MASPVRVRFAPSPTGYLHVGGARTALFNFLYARRLGGVFVLRIEDTDQDRNVREALPGLFEGLKWLGLTWDEGPDVGGPHPPYFQSERLPAYAGAGKRLLDEGKAYRCFCDPEDLKKRREGALARGETPKYDRTCFKLTKEESEARAAKGDAFAIRFLMPVDGETSWEDEVRGTVTFQNATLDDFVILRADKHPTYNFAAVVDDAAMEITHVLRGDDHISNTPRQMRLYAELGLPVPRFGHLPMILGPDGTRLSKRHGAVSVTAFRDEGILPEAMVNFLALLGWAFDGEREMFTMKELSEVFSLERVSKNPAIFNYEKLDWMNGEYFRALPLATRADMVAEYLRASGLLPAALRDRAYLERAVEAVGDRLKRPRQFTDYASYLFMDVVEPEPAPWAELLAKPFVATRLKKLATTLADVDPWEHDPIEKATRGVAASEEVKAGEVIMPARIALTGKKVSPGIFDVMLLLGRERVVERLRHAADRLEAESPAPTS